MVKITDYLKINLFAKTVKTFDDVTAVNVNYVRNEVEINYNRSLSGGLSFNTIVDSFDNNFLARFL